MRRREVSTGAAIVQIQVQLLNVLPPVWRRIQIPAAATMADLHEVLQAAMGWTNSHLHEFRTDADHIGVPDPDGDDAYEVRDEATVLVGEFATAGAALRYIYDFGDNWRHDLMVELIAVAEVGARYPRCLDGAGPCPPEDGGGPGGYGHPNDFEVAATDRGLARLAWKNTVAEPVAPKIVRKRETSSPGLRLDLDEDETPRDVITLRCTGKMLKVLRPAAHDLIDAPASPRDWYANLLWIDKRKCVLVTHAGTLFSLFLPDVRAADLRPIGLIVVPALHAELAREGLPLDTFGQLNVRSVQLAKTADRSILAAMNDLGSRCEWIIGEEGGLAHAELAKLQHGLQRNPSGARAYAVAIELVRQEIEAEQPPQAKPVGG